MVSLYLWPTSGTVDVLGGRFGRMDAREQRRRIGYAGSALEAEMDEALSPSQLVLSARHAALAPWWHVYDDADRARAAALIERFGIAHVADHPFRTLSSGERRRVSIARALMPDPDLLLLDEPGAGLDLGARETLIRDLTGLAGEPRPESIVLVSHHVEEIPPGFGHALVLADGAGRCGRADRGGRERGRPWAGLRDADRGRATRRPVLGATGGLSRSARWTNLGRMRRDSGRRCPDTRPSSRSGRIGA